MASKLPCSVLGTLLSKLTDLLSKVVEKKIAECVHVEIFEVLVMKKIHLILRCELVLEISVQFLHISALHTNLKMLSIFD